MNDTVTLFLCQQRVTLHLLFDIFDKLKRG